MDSLDKNTKNNSVPNDRNYILVVKFILIWVSIFIILFGWENKNINSSIIGSFIYILALLLDIYRTYVLTKEYIKINPVDLDKLNKYDDGFYKVISFFDGVVFLGSFIGVLVFKGKAEYFFYPCMIIFIGSILAYYLGGAIIREVTNLPLHFNYGSWKIKHTKRRR